jgi:hypothetical protein
MVAFSIEGLSSSLIDHELDDMDDVVIRSEISI